MKLGEHPITRSDTKYRRTIKRELHKSEHSIYVCFNLGFSIEKLLNSRAWYIAQIKRTQKEN
jgi:hypothetical protein